MAATASTLSRAKQALRQSLIAHYSTPLALACKEHALVKLLQNEAYHALGELGFASLEATPAELRKLKVFARQARKDDSAYRVIAAQTTGFLLKKTQSKPKHSREIWREIYWQITQDRNPQ